MADIEFTSSKIIPKFIDKRGSEDSENVVNLGVNMGAMQFDTAIWVFVDAMKHARPWFRIDPGNSEEENNALGTERRVYVNQYGYPSSSASNPAGVNIHSWQYDIPDAAAQPTYSGIGWKFEWRGKGVVKLYNGAGSSVTYTHTVADEYSIHELPFSPATRGIGLEIIRNSIGTSDDLRDFHLWTPGFAPGDPRNVAGDVVFHPLVFERLKPFPGPIRYIRWLQPNEYRPLDYPPVDHLFKGIHPAPENTLDMVTGTGVPRWNSNTGDIQYTTQGSKRQAMSIEYICKFHNALRAANGANKEMWLSFGCPASTEWMEEMANQCATYLDSDIDIMLEYGNEVWNAAIVLGQKLYQWLEEYVLPNIDEQFTRVGHAYGYECWRTYKAFKDYWVNILGQDGNRIVRFLGGNNQSGVSWLQDAHDAYMFYAAAGGEDYEAGGSAVYIKIKGADQAPTTGYIWNLYCDGSGASTGFTDLQPIFDYLRDTGDDGQLNQVRLRAIANRNVIGPGRRYITYEGGQHLATSSIFHAVLGARYKECQSDLRMFALYQDLFEMLKDPQINLDAATMYCFEMPGDSPVLRYGNWYLIEALNEDIVTAQEGGNQKYRACLQGRNYGDLLDNETEDA